MIRVHEWNKIIEWLQKRETPDSSWLLYRESGAPAHMNVLEAQHFHDLEEIEHQLLAEYFQLTKDV